MPDMTSFLKQLTLSSALPSDQLTDLEQAKFQLAKSLDRQITMVEQALNDDAFLDLVQAWLRCEEPQMRLAGDQFYWQNHTGAWFIKLTLGNHILPISPQKPTVEVGHCEDIPNALETLKQAIVAGELDQVISLHFSQARKEKG